MSEDRPEEKKEYAKKDGDVVITSLKINALKKETGGIEVTIKTLRKECEDAKEKAEDFKKQEDAKKTRNH